MSLLQGRLPRGTPVPFLLLGAGVIAAAGLVGGLVSYFTSREAWLLLAEIAVAALGLVFIFRWRWGVFALLLYLPVAGLVENLLYPAAEALLLKDALIGATYLGFLLALSRREERWRVPRLFVAAVGVLSCICLVEAFNPGVASPLVALVGFRVLLFYVPLFIIGMALAQRSPQLLDQSLWLVLATALPTCLFAIWEWFLGPVVVSALSPALARTIWVIGPEATDSFIFRPASTFAFIGQFGAYLTFVALIAFGALHAVRQARVLIPLALLFATVSVTVILSAGRTTWFELPVAAIAIYLVRGRSGGLPRALPVIAVGLAIAFIVGQPVLNNRLPVLGRLDYLSAHLEAVTPGSADLFSLQALVGHGTGTALGAIRYVDGGTVPLQFESGWTIPIFMFGLTGLVAYVFLYAVVLRLSWAGLRSMAGGRRWLGAPIFCYVFLIAAVEGAVNYPPTNVFFWMFAGLLAGQARRRQVPSDPDASASPEAALSITPSEA